MKMPKCRATRQWINGSGLLGNLDGTKTFVGLGSGKDPNNPENGIDLRTEDRMGESYLESATSSPTVDVNAAAAAAQTTLDQSKIPADKGDKVVVTEKPK
jgi:hypothetical protein